MIDQPRDKSIAVRILDDKNRAAILYGIIMGIAERIVPARKGVVFGRCIRVRNVTDDPPVGFCPVGGNECHVVCSVRLPRMDRVGIRCQRGCLIALRVIASQESRIIRLCEFGQFMRCDTLHRTECPICVIGTELRPLMIGMIVNVLVLMIF